MYEDRKTADRCTEWMDPGPDLLQRSRFRCEFKAGHRGLHYAANYSLQNAEPMLAPTPRRWGTEEELAQELFLGESRVTVQKMAVG